MSLLLEAGEEPPAQGRQLASITLLLSNVIRDYETMESVSSLTRDNQSQCFTVMPCGWPNRDHFVQMHIRIFLSAMEERDRSSKHFIRMFKKILNSR